MMRISSSFAACAAAVALTVLGLQGCSPANTGAASEDTLARVLRTHELHVGYFIFEPTVMEGEDGQPRGVFVDLVEAIAQDLGAEVVYHEVDLANFAAGLQSRQFDVSIGATFATPQRATAVSFTSPIFYAGYTGVARPEIAGRYPNWQQLDRPGLRVAVKQGSAIDDFVREHFTRASVVRLAGPDLSLPLAAVSSGQADVGLMNQVTVLTYLREHPELVEVLADDPVAPTFFSWAVRPEDQRWLNFLNTSIQYYQDTGEFAEWQARYGIPLVVERRMLAPANEIHPEYWSERQR